MSAARRPDFDDGWSASDQGYSHVTIDAFFPIDLETGLLNRNGLIDSIHRSTLWWKRRREQFAVLAVYVPGVEKVASGRRPELISHLAATVAATMREIDEAGRVDDATYVVVLRDFQREGIPSVVDRVRTAIGAVADDPGFDPAPHFGFCLVGSGDRVPAAYLDAAIGAARRAGSDPVVVGFSES